MLDIKKKNTKYLHTQKNKPCSLSQACSCANESLPFSSVTHFTHKYSSRPELLKLDHVYELLGNFIKTKTVILYV